MPLGTRPEQVGLSHTYGMHSSVHSIPAIGMAGYQYHAPLGLFSQHAVSRTLYCHKPYALPPQDVRFTAARRTLTSHKAGAYKPQSGCLQATKRVLTSHKAGAYKPQSGCLQAFHIAFFCYFHLRIYHLSLNLSLHLALNINTLTPFSDR